MASCRPIRRKSQLVFFFSVRLWTNLSGTMTVKSAVIYCKLFRVIAFVRYPSDASSRLAGPSPLQVLSITAPRPASASRDVYWSLYGRQSCGVESFLASIVTRMNALSLLFSSCLVMCHSVQPAIRITLSLWVATQPQTACCYTTHTQRPVIVISMSILWCVSNGGVTVIVA